MDLDSCPSDSDRLGLLVHIRFGGFQDTSSVGPESLCRGMPTSKSQITDLVWFEVVWEQHPILGLVLGY